MYNPMSYRLYIVEFHNEKGVLLCTRMSDKSLWVARAQKIQRVERVDVGVK